ncbi:hypothetical protein A3K73_05660 [Candidatus Pacearchaeota archaeon RBG_13_36_9]|nr:MAG: hypothetical protein A3K73_05660 [Candidatus Pacearchaeota archaeon RBG_13_36_9]
MNRKSMAKIGAISIVAIVLIAIILVVVVTLFSSALIDKQEYYLGESIKFNMENLGDYKLKITTPSTSLIRLGSNDVFIFRPQEAGNYSVELWRGGGKQDYYFEVLWNGTENNPPGNETGQNDTEENETGSYEEEKPFGYDAIKIGESVNWSIERVIESTVRTKIVVPDAAENIKVYKATAAGKQEIEFEVRDSVFGEILDVINKRNEKEVIFQASGRIVVEYTTKGPEKQEKKLDERTKEIKIGSPEGVNYENVLAYTEIEASSRHFISVYWKEEKKFVDFRSYDLNEDGKVDRIEWIVPHLSEQTFEIVVISKAEHLDPGRNFISDVYSNVSVKDSIWQEIPGGNYLRVTFEKNLTNGNDITLYARGSGKVEVYEKNGNEKLMELDINGENWYKEYFREYLFQDSFDLLIFGSVELDYVIDPTLTNSPIGYTDPGSDWVNETGGYSDGGYYAQATAQNKYLIYYNYSFSIPTGSTINSVMIRVDQWASDGSDYHTVEVSWDGGAAWGSATALPASSTERTDWVNVTSNTTWTVDKLNNTNFQVRLRTQASGKPADYWRVDWVPVEVIYTEPISALSVSLNSPIDYWNYSAYNVYFNYTPSSTGTFINCSLWDNSSGTFSPQVYNSTAIINGTSNLLNKTYSSDGSYLWNIRCCDNTNCTFYYFNRTFTLDTAYPTVNIISPPDNNFSDSPYGVVFTYNVTDTSGIVNCSLVIDGTFADTDSTVSTSVNQNFTYGLSSGLHNWSVNCSDYAGNQNSSSTRTINISVAEQDWGATWYETSTSTYTSTAYINLENVRDGTANWMNATIASKGLYTMVSATSPFMGGQGGLLEASSSVSFLSYFLVPDNKGYVTWKVYISNSSGDTLLCQSGNDVTGGTRIATVGSNTSVSGSCNSPAYDLRVQGTDRIKLVLNLYNDAVSAGSFIHYWDDIFPSQVDLGNFSTLGILYTDLFAPTTDLSINTGEQFNVSCEVNCSVGRCMNTKVYVQYNTSSSDWANVSSSGNLILASGQTNGHSLGNVNTTTVWTNFTLQGNAASVNNIRCIGISNYSIDYGETTRQITVSAANLAPNVIAVTQNNYWRNESSIVLYYNASDDNNLLANCSLYLNGQLNQTNSSALLDAQTNNFTISAIADGSYNWSVQCFDTASLSNWSQNRTFYIDTSFPGLILNYPGIDDVLYISTVSFNFTATDNMVLNITCNLTVDGSVVDANFNVTNGTMVNRTRTGIGIGDHLWNVTCWDRAGNINKSETRNFTITDLPPTVLLIEPNNSYWHNESNITLYYNASDNNNLANCSLYLNGQFNQSNSSAILNGELSNFTIPFIADGEYNWTVNCTDNAGLNTSSSKRTFYIDTIFPEVDLNAPRDNNFSLTSSVYFNFTATDNLDTNLTCNLTINSAVTGGSNFNASNGTLTNKLVTGLTDGDKYWNVTCIDNAGNLNTSRTWMLNVTVYPSVALNTSDNSFFNYSDIYLNYTPSDNTNLSNCSLYLNGQFNQTNSSRVLNGQMNNFSLLAGSGYYNWSVVCYDYIGLKNWSANRTFTVDLAYPTINLSYPLPNQTIYDATVYFNYTAVDDLDTSIECNLTVNNSVLNYTFAVNGSVTSIPITFTRGGFKMWNVSCWDNAGNLNYSETRNFTLYLPPKVNLSRPDNNYWNNESSIVLFYNITEYNANIVNTTLYINGQVNQTNSSEVSTTGENNFTIEYLADGAYNWTVIVKDIENLIGTTVNRTFYIDTLPPNVTLSQPGDYSTVDTNNVSFNFTVYDNLAPNLTCNLSISGFVEDEFMDMVITEGQATARYMLLHDGDYYWSVECMDLAGNYNITEEWNFTVEAPPNVTLVSPEPDYRTNSSNITFVYLPEDYYPMIQCDLYIDGLFNDTDEGIEENENNQFDVYYISEGNHNWTVNCTDSDWNTFQPDVRFFTIDKTPPNVNLMLPLNDSGIDFNEGNITFWWNATDLLDSQLKCDLRIDGNKQGATKDVTSGTPYQEDIDTLTEGGHYWNVTCWDRAGNTNTSAPWIFNFTYPDFFINLTYFIFNTTSPAEDDLVLINATIRNLGGADVDSFVVQFYDGDPDSGGVQINGNKTLSILRYNTTETNVVWTADRGDSQIYVVIDPTVSSGGLLDEWNETNNEVNRSIIVGSWYVLYGNVTSESIYVLDDETSRVIKWFANDTYNGSIFVADEESIISWADVQAIGKNETGGNTSNDFADIDALLEMSGFSDSVYNVFTDSGTTRDRATFLIFQKQVNYVPVANSTNNTNFVTGILWDMLDDEDGQYSQADEEDLVFTSKINKGAVGAYGAYDYEVRIPAALREYKGTDSEVAIYIELY